MKKHLLTIIFFFFISICFGQTVTYNINTDYSCSNYDSGNNGVSLVVEKTGPNIFKFYLVKLKLRECDKFPSYQASFTSGTTWTLYLSNGTSIGTVSTIGGTTGYSSAIFYTMPNTFTTGTRSFYAVVGSNVFTTGNVTVSATTSYPALTMTPYTVNPTTGFQGTTSFLFQVSHNQGDNGLPPGCDMKFIQPNGIVYNASTSNSEVLYNSATRTFYLNKTMSLSGNYQYQYILYPNSGGNSIASSYYNLTVSPPTLNLTAPSSGASFNVGNNLGISWTTNGSVPNITIELIRGTSVVKVIANNISNNGSYNYTIPADVPAATDYKIKIYSSINTSIISYSNYNFTINSNLSLTISAPNGGETYAVGGAIPITWTSQGAVGNVSIELVKRLFKICHSTCKTHLFESFCVIFSQRNKNYASKKCLA